MDNSETQATMGTRHRINKTETTPQKNKKINNTDPTNKLGVNPDPHRVVISQKQCAKMCRFLTR